MKALKSKVAFDKYWRNNESDDSQDTKQNKKFLEKLTVLDHSYDKELLIDGQLWLRELFMKAQSNQKDMNLTYLGLWVLLTSFSYLIGAILLEKYTDHTDERFSQRTGRYVPFQILTIFGTWNVNFFNGLFLFYAHRDSSLRICLMRFISSSLTTNISEMDT